MTTKKVLCFLAHSNHFWDKRTPEIKKTKTKIKLLSSELVLEFEDFGSFRLKTQMNAFVCVMVEFGPQHQLKK
jgi:hypothetical protein